MKLPYTAWKLCAGLSWEQEAVVEESEGQKAGEVEAGTHWLLKMDQKDTRNRRASFKPFVILVL